MTRPYLRLGSDELMELFERTVADATVLRDLRDEAEYRVNNRPAKTKPTPALARLMILGAKARLRLKALEDGSLQSDAAAVLDIPVFLPQNKRQDELFRTAPPMQHSEVVSLEPMPVIQVSMGETAIQSVTNWLAQPSVSAEAAYRTLQVPPTSTWEAIEQARRALVQRAHPYALSNLPEQKRVAAAEAAKQANDAYLSLMCWRQT